MNNGDFKMSFQVLNFSNTKYRDQVFKYYFTTDIYISIVIVIYLLSTIIKHYKAACTINELDSKAALLHLQLPTN